MTQFAPLVKGDTTSKSMNVGSVIDEMDDKTICIPDYQRDSDQWDDPKKSLFIESMINNLTIPPIILYPEDDESGKELRQVVDGQQRLTTVFDYVKGQFKLSKEDEVNYSENVGSVIQNCVFAELPEDIRKQISRYTLNFIVLPKSLELNLRLEIFRRINEAGVPLSPQDLRLAMFGRAPRVQLIRLVGIFDPERRGSARMLEAAHKDYGLSLPWKNIEAWKQWWIDRPQAAGQAPSQMFLQYILARDLDNVKKLIDSKETQQKIGIMHDRTTTVVLNMYVAQLENEERKDAPKLLANKATLESWFAEFECWFNNIKAKSVPSVRVGSAAKVAYFIASASKTWSNPESVTEAQWRLIQVFLKEGPAKIKEAIGISYPVSKGKWPSQEEQIRSTDVICQEIKTK